MRAVLPEPDPNAELDHDDLVVERLLVRGTPAHPFSPHLTRALLQNLASRALWRCPTLQPCSLSLDSSFAVSGIAGVQPSLIADGTVTQWTRPDEPDDAQPAEGVCGV